MNAPVRAGARSLVYANPETIEAEPRYNVSPSGIGGLNING
jgi:hypothetical protein